MKKISFSKKSWHYWVASNVGDFDPHGDFCSYVRNFLFGAFMIVVGVSFASFCLAATGMEFYALYKCIATPVCEFTKFEKTFAIAVAIIAAIVLFFVGMISYSNYVKTRRYEIRNGLRPEPQPSFIKTAYRSIKEKTCIAVEFK
jgi:hypothetical protein